MEINKRLFEDVLSGKMKGTFVLRNGCKVESSKLSIDTSAITDYHISLNRNWYTYQGEFDLVRKNHPVDIVDFIPDTDMKENELTFEIPKGKIVDWDESKKQNKIVLKDKQLTYKDICKKLFKSKAYYTDMWGEIELSENNYECITDSNNATTEHQLECILAKNKLANVAKYLNDGWKPVGGEYYYHIVFDNDISTDFIVSRGTFLTGECRTIFKSKEFAQQAIEILGEETIKLALEPLGI